jgi:anti-sigma28 factor (negative regulator of flagellin synthesis)
VRIGSAGDIAPQGAAQRDAVEQSRAKQVSDAKSAQAAAAYRGDVARVSSEARGLSATVKSFDLEKVEHLRGAMASNRLQAHPQAIAARLSEEG